MLKDLPLFHLGRALLLPLDAIQFPLVYGVDALLDQPAQLDTLISRLGKH